MKQLFIRIAVYTIFILSFAELFSQVDSRNRTILEIPIKKQAKDSLDATKLPYNEENFTAIQDSAFFQALRVRLPASVMVNNTLIFSEKLFALERSLRSGQPLEEAIQNIKNMPPEFFIPTGQEIVQRRIAIENALSVPFVNTLPKVGFGFKIPVSSVASLLGMVEDVTPEIKYYLDFTTNVEVVVYSVKAVVIATLFNGVQPAGSYNLTWNGRDDNGKKMESGDYISEVRIGNLSYIRKRIILP